MMSKTKTIWCAIYWGIYTFVCGAPHTCILYYVSKIVDQFYPKKGKEKKEWWLMNQPFKLLSVAEIQYRFIETTASREKQYSHFLFSLFIFYYKIEILSKYMNSNSYPLHLINTYTSKITILPECAVILSKLFYFYTWWYRCLWTGYWHWLINLNNFFLLRQFWSASALLAL